MTVKMMWIMGTTLTFKSATQILSWLLSVTMLVA